MVRLEFLGKSKDLFAITDNLKSQMREGGHHYEQSAFNIKNRRLLKNRGKINTTNTNGLNQSQLEPAPFSMVQANMPLFREIRALNKSRGRIKNAMPGPGENQMQRKPSIKLPKKAKHK